MNKLNNISLQVKEDEEVEEIVTTDVTHAARVILFNDEWHTFDEVINQIIKAIKCTYERAEELTWEVHTNGKSNVFEGEIEECLKVSAVLEEISLTTKIEY